MDFKSRSTVTYLKRLRPYRLLKGAHHEDPFVRAIVEDFYPQETIHKLSDYTRGLYSIDLHYKNFRQFEHPVSEEIELANQLRRDPHVIQAINYVREKLAPAKGTNIIPTNNFDQVAWIGSSAAGFGYIGKKKDNYPKARHNASRALYEFRKWRKSYRFVPDKAYARSQLAMKANPKIRHVWGRAFHHILIEGLIGQPLMTKLMTFDNPVYIGKDIHKDMPYDIIRLVKDAGYYIFCLDFSGFDSSILRFLINIAWNILEELLDFKDSYEYDVFLFCKQLFMNTVVVMPDGRLYLVQCGVPSGSFFTQLIDSIVNLIVMYSFQISKLGHILDTNVMGDDSIFAHFEKFFTLEEAATYFLRFRLKLNLEKSVITQKWYEIVFLGHNLYGPSVTRDEFTCLSLALYTEDEVTAPEQSCVRLASLLYDSGFNSFGLFNIYRKLLETYKIDWRIVYERPADIIVPFWKLFILS